MEGVLHLETWVILTVNKTNLETYTKLPQTSSVFIPEAIVYNFLYKLMVITYLSCMAYIMHRHNIPVPEGTWASKHNINFMEDKHKMRLKTGTYINNSHLLLYTCKYIIKKEVKISQTLSGKAVVNRISFRILQQQKPRCHFFCKLSLE